jgi:hypothetical protein
MRQSFLFSLAQSKALWKSAQSQRREFNLMM